MSSTNAPVCPRFDNLSPLFITNSIGGVWSGIYVKVPAPFRYGVIATSAKSKEEAEKILKTATHKINASGNASKVNAGAYYLWTCASSKKFQNYNTPKGIKAVILSSSLLDKNNNQVGDNGLVKIKLSQISKR